MYSPAGEVRGRDRRVAVGRHVGDVDGGIVLGDRRGREVRPVRREASPRRGCRGIGEVEGEVVGGGRVVAAGVGSKRTQPWVGIHSSTQAWALRSRTTTRPSSSSGPGVKPSTTRLGIPMAGPSPPCAWRTARSTRCGSWGSPGRAASRRGRWRRGRARSRSSSGRRRGRGRTPPGPGPARSRSAARGSAGGRARRCRGRDPRAGRGSDPRRAARVVDRPAPPPAGKSPSSSCAPRRRPARASRRRGGRARPGRGCGTSESTV